MASLLASLQKTTNRLVDRMGTDSVFVLRKTSASNGKGGKVGAFTPTTATPYSCFYSLVTSSGDEQEKMRADARRPVIYYRFVLRSDVDVKATDKLRLVAARGVAQKDVDIVRVADVIGLTREVIAVEEVPL